MLRFLAILLIVYSLIGCTIGKTLDWRRVSFIESAIGRHCTYRYEEEAEITNDDAEDDKESLAQKAVSLNANTVVSRGAKSKASGLFSFFLCDKNQPTFYGFNDDIWLAKSLHEPKTKIDFEKTLSTCAFEVHKAMVDTSHAPPSRSLYISPSYPTGNNLTNLSNATNSLANTMSQINAMDRDRKNEEDRALRLANDKETLFDECLKASGFLPYHQGGASAITLLNKHCPNQENGSRPCFIDAP